jgi:nitrous oxide reductase accessory protein NosL
MWGLFLLSGDLQAGERQPAKPTSSDKCPVCGMFVAKYPDWVAQIFFQDGSHAFFDGVKDMMKYYYNLEKYNPSKKIDQIDAVFVTDYYDLVMIDGRSAWYVAGSDVYGPMGRELIPFKTEEGAKEFMQDHAGKSIYRFSEITLNMVKALD